MRVNHSFIVNIDRIDTIERNSSLFGKNYIPVSDPYKDELQKCMDINYL